MLIVIYYISKKKNAWWTLVVILILLKLIVREIVEGCQLYFCYNFSMRSLGNKEVSNKLSPWQTEESIWFIHSDKTKEKGSH